VLYENLKMEQEYERYHKAQAKSDILALLEQIEERLVVFDLREQLRFRLEDVKKMLEFEVNDGTN